MKEVFTLLADAEGNTSWKLADDMPLTNAQVITALEILKHEIIQSIVDGKKVRELTVAVPSGMKNGLNIRNIGR